MTKFFSFFNRLKLTFPTKIITIFDNIDDVSVCVFLGFWLKLLNFVFLECYLLIDVFDEF